MKLKLLTGMGVLLAVAAGATAQTPTAAQMKELAAQHEMDKEELTTLQRETARAVQLHNGSFFRRVYSDDFVGIEPSGQVTDKTGFASLIETSRVRYINVIATDIRIRIFESTAVVTSLWSTRFVSGGVESAHQSRMIIVYVTSPRGWVAVASQETQLPG